VVTEINPASGNSVTPQVASYQYGDQYRGTFSKFQMIEDMGNGQSAIVFVTSVFGSAFVYKLPKS
jgi:hypothetical protein